MIRVEFPDESLTRISYTYLPEGIAAQAFAVKDKTITPEEFAVTEKL